MSDAAKRLVVAASAVLALVPAATVAATDSHGSVEAWRAGAAVGLLVAAIGAGGWFIYCFTGKAFDRRTKAIVFAYTFTFAALAAAFLSAPLSASTDLRAKMAASPIGVVLGCVSSPKRGSGQAVDVGAIRCGGIGDQWLLNIGGRVREKLVPPAGEAGMPRPRYAVSGGLVVPLYFVILAMMGGAVSWRGASRRSRSDPRTTMPAPRSSPNCSPARCARGWRSRSCSSSRRR
jgi:hypothetical protein